MQTPGRLTTTISGLETSYSVAGSGPPILLLHGGRLGYSLDVWREVADALAERGFRVISFDHPGYGLTENPPDYSTEFRLDFIREVIQKLCEQPAHIVGHSNSGLFAARLGIESPELARSIVIAGTGPIMPVTLALAATLQRDVGYTDFTREPTIEETRTSFLPDVFDPGVLTPERLASFNSMSKGKNLVAAAEREKAAAINRERERSDTPLWRRLDELTMPVMGIFGADDQSKASVRAPMMAERYPDIEIHLVEYCRHIIQWDAPQQLVDLVAKFVTRVSTSS